MDARGILAFMIRNGMSSIEKTAVTNALFLRSFEDWVTASISCEAKGETTGQRITTMKESYERAIKSNINYHNLMAKTEAEGGNEDSAELHEAMAKAYSSFIMN